MQRYLVRTWATWLCGLPLTASLVAQAAPAPERRAAADPPAREASQARADAAVRARADPGAPAMPLEAQREPGFVLRGVHFEEDGALPSAGRDALIAPFLGQWMTLTDLEALRYRLTEFYVEQGYINSGVLIVPDQTIRDGILRLRVLTGRLTEIRVSGQGRLKPAYLAERLQRAPEAPLNRAVLQERFQLLLEDPLIEQLDGELMPGLAPGSAVLELEVTRARPWDAYVRLDNHRPPSTGATRLYLGGALHNLTGQGDILDLYLGRGFEGQGREGALEWSVPLNTRDTRLWARYERSDAALVEEPLADLDIRSETERLELGLSHPLWNRLSGTFTLSGLLSWAENETTIDGGPFSFPEGAEDGETRATALRLRQDLLYRTDAAAYALRSVLSLGLDALDATIHPSRENRPDSRFVSWQGQAQAVWRLNEQDTRLILRGGVQWAGDALLSLEQFAVGGANSVRGYRENEQVGDNGYHATLELRHPIWEGPLLGLQHRLQLAVFSDVGSAWDRGRWGEHEDLAAIGAGLIWTADERLRAELYFGHALTEPVATEEHNLQDDGIHFLVQLDL